MILLLIVSTDGYIGYDCGGPALNITTVQISEVENCQFENQVLQNETIYIQFLQLAEFAQVDVKQCMVEIDRTILHCGMHSHNSLVGHGRRVYLMDISLSQCLEMQQTGFLNLGGNQIIREIRRNGTTHATLDVAGTIEADGKCSGGTYSDPYGSYSSVIVEMAVKIILNSYSASVRTVKDEIILKTGTKCSLSEGTCFDPAGGWTFWTGLQSDSCSFSNYDVLYEGLAQKITNSKNIEPTPDVYTLSSQGTTFALTKKSETFVCGYKIIQTEHPKLIVIETSKNNAPVKKKLIAVNNLDIFAYVNSKFVFIEKFLGNHLKALYNDVMVQKCAMEKQILSNQLSIAEYSAEEFAFSYMKGAGYTAIKLGESIHILKCIPVKLKIRHTDECYLELPVFHGNISVFVSPKTRIIRTQGTQIECNDILPVMYQIDDEWYELSPKPKKTFPPQKLKPLTKPKWKYISPESLATSGIYSEINLARLRDHIMHPVEQTALVHTMIRGAMGHEIPKNTFSFYNFMDEKTLKKIAESTSKRIWNGFVIFGSTTAGILGIWMTFKIFKLIIDTIIHGLTIYSVFGWSFRLLAAFWSSLTNLMLYLNSSNEKNEETKPAVSPSSTIISFKEENEIEKTENLSAPQNPKDYVSIKIYPEVT